MTPAPASGLSIVGMGLLAILRLAGLALRSLVGLTGDVKSRLAARIAAPDGLRLVFEAARAFLPNVALSRKFVASYANGGSVLVTRRDDVKDVLSRDGDFEVVYGPRMMLITGGENFFLGMQDTPVYHRDTSNMRRAMRAEDVPAVVAPFAARRAVELVAAAPGRIDVPRDLTLRVPVGILDVYFGTPGPSEADMIAWTTIMFWYLFADLDADAGLDAHALDAAAKCRAYLDGAIAARKAAPAGTDDVLGRCLSLQAEGAPGMDDLGIRNNLIGLLIGAVPTISKACVQALDQLLLRPDALAAAAAAARADDDAGVAAHVFEALRFNPVNPVIYRRATRDAVIASGTRREVTAPKSSMVFAANLSAMFDPLHVEAPADFRAGRPWDDYMLWGYGMHTCFGAQINRAVIPAILKPLLARPGLRRAPGAAGQISTEGTPFPVHLWLLFDPA